MSAELFDFLIKDMQDKKQAYLGFSQQERPVQVHTVVVDLGKSIDENAPMIVNFPYRSVFVAKATDATCEIYLRPITKEGSQPPFRFGMRDSWAVDYQIPRCFLHWPIQPGKSMELLFFADSEFRSGSQISLTSGGVSISEGMSVSNEVVTLAANTADIIAPQNFIRNVSTLQNRTGATLYIGGSGVKTNGADEGINIDNGQIFYWKNTGALYGISTGGGRVIRMDEV